MIGLFLSIICFCIAYASWEISKTVELREVFFLGTAVFTFLGIIFFIFYFAAKKDKERNYGHEKRNPFTQNIFKQIEKDTDWRLWKLWWETLPSEYKKIYDKGYKAKKSRYFWNSPSEDEILYEKLDIAFKKFSTENKDVVQNLATRSILRESIGNIVLTLGIATGGIATFILGAKIRLGLDITPLNIISAVVGISGNDLTDTVMLANEAGNHIAGVSENTLANTTVSTDTIMHTSIKPIISIEDYKVDLNNGMIYKDNITVGHIEHSGDMIIVKDSNYQTVSITKPDGSILDNEGHKIAKAVNVGSDGIITDNSGQNKILIKNDYSSHYSVQFTD